MLQTRFDSVLEGEGHCVFISGESGIGKTTLVKAFSRSLKNGYKLYQGTCDALFMPRPLAPLHDIAWQLRSDFWKDNEDLTDRAGLFTRFFYELNSQKEACVLLFGDIH